MRSQGFFYRCWLLLAMLLFTCQVQASLSVKPAFLHMDLTKRNPSGVFTIANLSDEEQVYRARAMHFIVTESGTLMPADENEFSLAHWIKFNPKEFTLPPKSSRKVRFSVVNRTLSEPREYWGAIEFTPLKYTIMNSEDAYGHKMQVKVLSRILVPIYGLNDGINFSGSALNLRGINSNDMLQLSALIDNDGDGVLRLQGLWQVFRQGESEPLQHVDVKSFIVLPKLKRQMRAQLEQPLPPGNYELELLLTESRSKVDVSNRASFTIE
tara:strand:+ start:4554 stop:5357 length:804 start_codon:yes stop_codon:yes gene_type:complete